MRYRQPSLLGLSLGVLLAVTLLAGLWLDSALASATHRARGTLPRALTQALREAPSAGAEDVRSLHEASALVTAAQHDRVAELLGVRTQDLATPTSHRLAAHAALAAGDFDGAARHAHFARRLEPTVDRPTEAAERAVDLAVLARLRPLGRIAAAASGLLLLGLGWRAVRRRRYQRRLRTWLAGIEGRVACRVDGETVPEGDLVVLGAGTSQLTVDVFLTPRGALRTPPRPGPTLAVVLSQGASNRTVRLTPHHDVHDDAVRIRVRDATLARILECPGAWRLHAQLDGRLVGEARLAVAPRPPRRGLRLHLVGQA